MTLGSLINECLENPLWDIDGNLRRTELNSGLSERDIHAAERTLELRLPDDYREFLTVCNGAVLYGLELPGYPHNYMGTKDLLMVHVWGNGDFDCIEFDKQGVAQDIIFMNHNPSIRVKIAPSFDTWIHEVIDEVRQQGELLHPGDYRFEDGTGVYSHVLAELAGVECELNS